MSELKPSRASENRRTVRHAQFPGINPQTTTRPSHTHISGINPYFSGSHLVLMNATPTNADADADLIIRDPVAQSFERIMDELK